MTEQPSGTSPMSKKRSHDEAEGLSTSGALAEKTEETHLPTSTSPSAPRTTPGPCKQASPPTSTESSALNQPTFTTLPRTQSTPPPSTSHADTKKRKVTLSERQDPKVTQEPSNAAQEKQKDEERQARDEEKRRKEGGKEAARRQRELDKAEKQKARDESRQVRDEAKRRKEEEKKARILEKEDAKNKKERAQLRLAAFFQKQKAGEAPRDPSRSPSRRSSVISLVGIGDTVDEAPTKASPPKRQGAKSAFLSFFLPKNVKMAPLNRFSPDQNLANMALARLDQEMQPQELRDSEAVLSRFRSQKRKRGQGLARPLKEIIEKTQGTSTSPIDLTGEATISQLRDIPYKILSFAEDVRPPYIGTYTRSVSPSSVLKLSRCPFTRKLPSVNYDYDSEAEWEPPNEGDEDLDSGDDESDLGEEGEEDMDGFLDDEDDPGRKKQVMGEMTPISSGLCWASTPDEQGPLEEYRIQTLSDSHRFPIDPHSADYWTKPSHLLQQQQQQPQTAAMQPPRLPLSNLNPNKSPSSSPSPGKGERGEEAAPTPGGVFRQFPSGYLTNAPAMTTPRPGGGKPLKLIPEHVLPSFKQAVKGSDLSKAGLVEVLKKQFPKLSKDTIRHTLGYVATREGNKEVDKKWVLKE